MQAGRGVREISRRINRHPSVVSREIERNGNRICGYAPTRELGSSVGVPKPAKSRPMRCCKLSYAKAWSVLARRVRSKAGCVLKQQTAR